VSPSLALRRAPAPPAIGAPRVSPADVALAGLVLAVEVVLAAILPEEIGGLRPDLLGWTLLAGGAVVLVWRRAYPMWCMIGMVAFVAPYHYLENVQRAPIPSTMVALYALAVVGPPVRTFLVTPAVIGTMFAVISNIGIPHASADMLETAGWIVAVAVAGEMVRVHRDYVAAIVERAERAERTREEEAARRVAEERLRIARDLHDLLAHSITLIGVQTSVAAHVLLADPDRLDRAAVAAALDTIADTCREARSELRTTLRVLRVDGDGPLPDLAGIPSLTEAAEAAGARVELTVRLGAEPVPPAVGAAAYRIVQESLTNAVRHAGAADPRVRVLVERTDHGLRLLVEDDGGRQAGKAPGGDRTDGFGIVGMRERARSVGGALSAGPRPDAPGFAVAAVLPLTADHHQAGSHRGDHG
jgi:signal transduction histidine kinase